MADNIIAQLLELAEIEEDRWDRITAAIPEWHPRNESGGSGSGSGGKGSGSGGSSGKSSGDKDDDDDDDDGDDDDDDTTSTGKKKDVDWKAMARKHEREAKKQRRRADDAEKKVSERETADQSDHEKAVKAAREEGEKKAKEEADKERRTDRLENATLKLASKGFKITVKDGDDEVVKTIKFADPDDAFTYVERMLRREELDEDDIFDDKGRVNTEALSDALAELLEEKPHLQGADGSGNGHSDGERRKVQGRADAGRGSGGKRKSVEELSVEEHLKRIQNRT